MLPKQLVELLERYAGSFDAEHRQMDEFARAVEAGCQRQGGNASESQLKWDRDAILKSFVEYFESRSRFIWTKCQEIVSCTNVEAYPDLARDLKSLIEAHCTPILQAAMLYFEGVSDGLTYSHYFINIHSMHIELAVDHVLARVNADVDLFCATYTRRKKELPTTQVFNVGTVHGTVGNITNSQVTLSDYSSVGQILVDQGIPKQDRRELEDLMDELKEAPPEKKPSLLKRGEEWIVKHKEFLGAGAEAVGKAIGTAAKH